MKNQPENLPVFLLELLSNNDWQDLNQNEIKEVLEFISEDEYKLLRNSYINLKNAHQINVTEHKNSTKLSVMQAYRKKHKVPLVVKIQQSKIHTWQAAAAAILLFLTGFLLKPNANKETILSTNYLVDTIYIEKSANFNDVISDKISKEDTALLIENKTIIQSENKPKNKVAVEKFNKNPNSQIIKSDDINLNILRVNDRENISPGGKSWNEDSLSEKFGFVKI